jgi:hypothetical protein
LQPESYPVKLKHTLRVGAPQPVYQTVACLLERAGFQVRQTRVPTPHAKTPSSADAFSGLLQGTQDLPVKNSKRTNGGLILIVALIVLGIAGGVMIVSGDVTNLLLVGLILAGTILGGLGMGQILEAAPQLRRLVEVHFEGVSHPASGQSKIVSDMKATVYAGIGVAVDGENVEKWLHEHDSDALGTGPSSSLRLDRQIETVIRGFALEASGLENATKLLQKQPRRSDT